MELKSLSPILLTPEVARIDSQGAVLKGEAIKDLVKNALIYGLLRKDKELFDEFYKKLLWWKDFYGENKENRPELLRQLKAIALWLEKKVLCGGEPEIVNGEVINFDEKKNLLNFVKAGDFVLKEGKVEEEKVKLVGRVKKFLKPQKGVSKGSTFEGELSVDESYKELNEPSPAAEYLDNLAETLNRYSLKILEIDKAFFADRGYSKTVRRLEDIEAESGDRLWKINVEEGVLPYAVEVFAYERLETPKGRKEYLHLGEIFEILTAERWTGDIFKEVRKISPDGYPFGWLSQI